MSSFFFSLLFSSTIRMKCFIDALPHDLVHRPWKASKEWTTYYLETLKLSSISLINDPWWFPSLARWQEYLHLYCVIFPHVRQHMQVLRRVTYGRSNRMSKTNGLCPPWICFLLNLFLPLPCPACIKGADLSRLIFPLYSPKKKHWGEAKGLKEGRIQDIPFLSM